MIGSETPVERSYAWSILTSGRLLLVIGRRQEMILVVYDCPDNRAQVPADFVPFLLWPDVAHYRCR
jgi:hypothetical protein